MKRISPVLRRLATLSFYPRITVIFQLGSSLYKHLLEANKPANMVNVSKDPRFNPESDTLTGYHLQNISWR